MIARPRLKMIAASIGFALVQSGAGSAFADTAVGVDTALGNALNPPGRSAMPRPLADDGFDTVRRTPTGQLYGVPFEREDRTRTESGWEYHGGVDIGVLAGEADKKNRLFRNYKDLKNGVYLDYFEAEAEKVDAAKYLQTFGGGVGQHDQFYSLQYGRYNDYKIKVFYNETKHSFTDTYKPLFDGSGTGNLTLAGGLKPLGGATPVTTGAPTIGTGTCTAAAPCWRYAGADGVSRVFSSATALIGINWTGSATTVAGTAVSPNSIAGAINTYLNTFDGTTELGVIRKKAGVSAEVHLTDTWKGYASLTHERRTGARPFNMNENNYTVEIPEPVDYITHDLLAGLSYTTPLTQANLRASASLFRNNISSLTVQQPWLAAATGVAAAQNTIFDLYPDNSAFNLKGEFARSLPDFFKGRFTANAAWGTSRQDDALMLPVDPSQSAQIIAAMGSPILAGINNPGYATNTLNLNNWNGVNGSPLSQNSAKQRIDTKLLNATLSLRPVADLTVKGELRHFESDNKGGYTAYNPLTGQFGRGFRNSTSFDMVVGSSGAPGAIGVPCYVLPGFAVVPGCTFNGNLGITGQSTNNPANIPVFGPARDTKQDNFAISADYDVGKRSSVNGSIEREDFHRTYREREKTWEDKLKIGYVNRGIEDMTLRGSYENARRRGSAYEFWPTEDLGTGLPGLDWNTIVSQYLKLPASVGWTVAPASLAGYLARYAYESRKYDQADRDQQTFNARLNFMLRSDTDLGISLQHKDVTYPNSGYGLEKDRLSSVNLDANFQPSIDQQFYGYYSWQAGSKSMRANSGTNAAGANNTCIFTAGAALTTDQVVEQCAQQVWLAASTWNLDTRDANQVLGLGFQSALGKMKVGVEYVYAASKTKVGYDYGANVLTASQALLAGSAFPDMSLVQNTLSAHLLIPIDKRISAHLMYRHESGRIKDWHYDGMPSGASIAENNATIMLDGAPQNYHSNVFGVFFHIKL